LAVIGAFTILATLATFHAVVDPFSYYSICDRCGAFRRTTDWKLPLTDFTVFTRSTESDTPYSRTLLTNAIVPKHSHNWLFGHGGGHGVRCALGPGHRIRPAADSDQFARLVLMLHYHELTALRDRVVQGALDPDVSRLYFQLCFTLPKEPVSATELQEWFTEQSEYLDEAIIAFKRR
jgi:hypothetical protein